MFFQIYIPINNLKGHWYTAVVKIKERKVQIWDSLPSRRKNDQSRVKLVKRLVKVQLHFGPNYLYIYRCYQLHLRYSFMNSLCFFQPLTVFQLLSLDFVLETEINTVFGSSFSFQSFSIESALGPTQPNEYDCGVFVCMFMNDYSVAINPDIIATVSDNTNYRFNFPLSCDLITFSTIVVVQLGKSTPHAGTSTGNILYKYPF